MLKKIITAVLLFATALSITSCGGKKSFTYADLTLTLDRDFYEEDSADYDLLVTNGKATAALTRLSFVDAIEQNVSGAMSADAFANYLLLKNGQSADVYMRKEYAYYTYYETTSEGRLYCMATFYRTAYAYVVVLYATSSSREAEYREKFFEYADSAVMSLDAN